MKMCQNQEYTSGCVPIAMADRIMGFVADGVCVLKNGLLNVWDQAVSINNAESIFSMDDFFAYIYSGSHDSAYMGASAIRNQSIRKPSFMAVSTVKGNNR